MIRVFFLFNYFISGDMKYLQDLSISEIAIITGTSKNNVAVQEHRGLEKLKMLYNFKMKTKVLSKVPGKT